MTLPASGQLAMSQINTELSRTSSSQISLDSAENGVYAVINANSTSRPSSNNPAAISEWYGYNHRARPPVGVTLVGLPEVGYAGTTDQAPDALDRACRNSVLRPGRYWGSDTSLVVSMSEQQFWSNAAGTTRPPAGYYAQSSGDASYWNGTSPTTLDACRI